MSASARAIATLAIVRVLVGFILLFLPGSDITCTSRAKLTCAKLSGDYIRNATSQTGPAGLATIEGENPCARCFGPVWPCWRPPASPVSAQEVTLRAVSAFAEGTQFSKNFERFIEKVNRDGKGVVQINYIGGPRAMPPFEVGNAVRTKVVDMANVTGAFYTNLMPESDGFKLIGKPMSEQRRNGTWDYLNQLHNQKLNSQYLARQFHNVPFHIYLNKKIDKHDFAGLKIRVTPVYRDVVEAYGGTPITTAPGEVYTALERGVVDGYGWPVTGIFDLGWDKVTKFRMEPAFYSVEVNVLVNLDSWKALNDAQRKVLSDAALWLEELDSENNAAVKAERDRQVAAGIQPLDFGVDAAKAFLARANDVAWQSVIKKAPEPGAKLRQLAGN